MLAHFVVRTAPPDSYCALLVQPCRLTAALQNIAQTLTPLSSTTTNDEIEIVMAPVLLCDIRNTTVLNANHQVPDSIKTRIRCFEHLGAFQLEISVDQDLSVIVAEAINDDHVQQRLVPIVFTRA